VLLLQCGLDVCNVMLSLISRVIFGTRDNFYCLPGYEVYGDILVHAEDSHTEISYSEVR
jgi:hypothetical protein